ncbi:NAD-dependent epimerase/dehydratase family protein [Protaetiibacter larvae]|uniref:NAD-dependent epimerase/dehydratase family protein n=1 Tax=Protaetiibacter larvae TaxID=2592654 RepID=A0A5C1Y6M3_9MICO|nr:NAD-dependent epimerase/dehydratase family protein [Protaetiibacter larvae]QEO09436.1 NAD-dependent epimerase/dehydratase family protein [Protaetiibacter larvae]
MRSVVTGGAGFLGSHLVELLLDLGDEVVVLDDESTGRPENLRGVAEHPRLSYRLGSVLDAPLVSRTIAGADRVFHLAAAVGVRRIVEHPLDGLRVNLHGTENVLDACVAHAARLLLVSTSEIYGKNTSDALREDADRILGSPLVARWTYAAAKGLDEAFAHAYAQEFGLEVAIARPFNTVGPRQTGRYGMVVPNLVGQALREEPLTVYGDGLQSRCFSSVRDVVPAFVRLSEEPRALTRAVNLGGGTEISILELAERIIRITGSRSEITFIPYEAAYGEGFEDMRRRVPDNSLARELIGFVPRTGIDEIIWSVASTLGDPGVARSAEWGALRVYAPPAPTDAPQPPTPHIASR